MSDKPKSIYDLKLHETTSVNDGGEAMRVSSGWVYRFWEETGDGGFQSCVCFAPYSEEFKKTPFEDRRAVMHDIVFSIEDVKLRDAASALFKKILLNLKEKS